MESALHSLLYLSTRPLDTPFDTQLGPELAARIKVSRNSLLRVNELLPSEPPQSALHFLVIDLDDLAKTKPLNSWSLKAWKSSFNEALAKFTYGKGQVPLLLGWTHSGTWEKSQIAVRVGCREIICPENIHAVFREQLGQASVPWEELSKSEEIEASGDNLIRLPSGRKNAGNGMSIPIDIPQHAIPFPIEGLEGRSQAVEVVRSLIRKTATLDTPVLIVGNTGCGKELVAKSLHRYSHRADGPLINVNCGAMSPDLVEAELFGCEAGAYTGAENARPGLITAAHRGTLFLDEVSELPSDMQVKLLRVLQEKTVTPVGGVDSHAVDFRLIAATKENLEDLCDQGRFRRDLYYRLKVMEIVLPSLKERRSDIPEIAKSLLKKLSKRHKKMLLEISEGVVEKFLLHNWPGNIRELENALEHAATLAWAEDRALLEVRDLPEDVQFASMKTKEETDLKEVVRRFEREYILSTVRRLGGSKEAAAETLGLSLATLYRKIGGE